MGENKIYGNKLGKSDYSDCVPVIGSVSSSGTGNTVIEVGVEHGGGWQKTGLAGTTEVPRGAGHIVLTPEEREELIETLESHRGYRMIKLGDRVGQNGAVVLAVQYLNASADDGRLRGTVLAWDDSKREYAVLMADPYGDVHHGTYTSDPQGALNAYATRTIEHLYTHFNASPPSITFGHVAERDKLRSDA